MFIFSYKIFIRLISCFAFVAKRPKSFGFRPVLRVSLLAPCIEDEAKTCFCELCKKFCKYFYALVIFLAAAAN